MGLFNPVDNSINLKIVYYGPAFGGKTTNLIQAKSLLDPDGAQKVLSVDTDDDTTLFFDYLPLQFRLLDKYVLRVQGYTVPGQVRYNTTRKLVLKGADGVVFVADSTAGRLQENIDSMLNLYANLSQMNIDTSRFPLVVQYNKQDVDEHLAPEQMDQLLNQFGHPSMPAVAINAQGVAETFEKVLEMVLTQIHSEYQMKRRGLTLEDTLRAMSSALRVPRQRARALQSKDTTRNVFRVKRKDSGSDPNGDLDASGLLEGSIKANLEMSARTAKVTEERDLLARDMRNVRQEVDRIITQLDESLAELGESLEVIGKRAPQVKLMEAHGMACLGAERARTEVKRLARMLGGSKQVGQPKVRAPSPA